MVTKQPGDNNDPAGTPAVLKPDPQGDSKDSQVPQIEEHPIDAASDQSDNSAQPQPVPGGEGTVVGNDASSGSGVDGGMMSQSGPLVLNEQGEIAGSSNQAGDAGSDVVSNSTGKNISAISSELPQPVVADNAVDPAQPLPSATPSIASTQPAGVVSNTATPPAQDRSGAAPITASDQTRAAAGDKSETEDKEKLEKTAKKMVKELDKDTKAMKKARGGDPKPPPRQDGGSKKKGMVVAAAILLMAGLGIAAGMRLLSVPGSQDTRSQAGSIGQGGCTSDKGLKVTSSAGKGDAGDLGYKPMTTNITDPNSTYNVKSGETVRFQTKIQNKSSKDVDDAYQFAAFRVLEAPKGTSVNENTPIGEEQMYNIHYDQGTTQEPVYQLPWTPFTFPKNSEVYIEAEWTPTNDDCGMYQLDMAVQDFRTTGSSGYCSENTIVAAGFIRVIGCEEPVTPTPTKVPSPTPTKEPTPTPNPSCDEPCASDSQCPADHKCSDVGASGKVCQIDECADSSSCTCVVPSPTPTPIIGCGDTCQSSTSCEPDLTCYTSSGTPSSSNPGTCINAACSIDEQNDACVCSVLACIEIAPKSPSDVLGKEVTFSCTGSPSELVDHANFQYKVGSASEWQTLSSDSTDPMQAKLLVDSPGTYTVRCQVCKAGTPEECTDWQVLTQ